MIYIILRYFCIAINKNLKIALGANYEETFKHYISTSF